MKEGWGEGATRGCRKQRRVDNDGIRSCLAVSDVRRWNFIVDNVCFVSAHCFVPLAFDPLPRESETTFPPIRDRIVAFLACSSNIESNSSLNTRIFAFLLLLFVFIYIAFHFEFHNSVTLELKRNRICTFLILNFESISLSLKETNIKYYWLIKKISSCSFLFF